MSTAAITPDPFAAYGGKAVSSSPDPFAAYGGKTVSQAQDAPQPEGFWHSLGAQFGLTPEAAQAAAQDEKDHPVKAALWNALGPAGAIAKGLYEQGKQSAGELGQAYQELKAKNPAAAGVHALQAVPIVGPAMSKAADQYADKNYAGEAGTLTGAAAQVAPTVLAGADAALPNRPMVSLPSRANAGAVFNDLSTKLATQPVDLKATVAPLQRATEIGVRGGSLPKPVSDLLVRSQSPIPMTFPEARDYQMALTDLSRADAESISPRMKGQIAQINQALYNDIHSAAETQGMGSDFADAMKEYRRASQIRNAAQTVKDAAIKTAVPAVVGAGGYTAYRSLKDIGK